MSELNNMHFLKISGIVDRRNQNEFEKTIKFACGLMTPACLEKSLSCEILFGDACYFFMSWYSETELRVFMNSNEYQLIRSAYDALGRLQKIEIAYNAEIKTITIHQL